MVKENLRSINPLDYQDLPQTVGAMSKKFEDGYEIALHHHERDQLLYATSGIMRLRTEREAWIVPSDNAVYIPANVLHAVTMHGDVDMRTLYIDSKAAIKRLRSLRVVGVSPLLRELILALNEEAVDYAPGSRGAIAAQMIELEIDRAEDVSLSVPLPKDARLQRLCAALLSNPSDRRTLDGWSEAVGASPRTLARLFERDLGMSFSRWRQRIRFHNALEHLARGDAISQIAHQHGYKSASAFSAAFNKVMGMPPSRMTAEQ